jgi:hypothetical protein
LGHLRVCGKDKRAHLASQMGSWRVPEGSRRVPDRDLASRIRDPDLGSGSGIPIPGPGTPIPGPGTPIPGPRSRTGVRSGSGLGPVWVRSGSGLEGSSWDQYKFKAGQDQSWAWVESPEGRQKDWRTSYERKQGSKIPDSVPIAIGDGLPSPKAMGGGNRNLRFRFPA